MTTPTTLKLGTRGSPLAMWQANHVCNALQQRWPDLRILLVEINTTGDINQTQPLPAIGTDGIFTKEIEKSLLDYHIDVAVHSLKDLPTHLPPGLTVGAIMKRTHGGDVLVSKNHIPLVKLPHGATIATGSLRRMAQLLHYRPDLQIVNIRGNVNTRLKKFNNNDWDGMILAEAGMLRLGKEDEISERIPFDIMLPAVGQGALGVEIRAADKEARRLLKPLIDEPTKRCAVAERRMLHTLQGGCQTPIAARADIEDNILTLNGLVSDLDGVRLVRDTIHGSPHQAARLGEELAERLIDAGGCEILEEIRGRSS
jgi:hydroxymethylbilane synthase